MTWNCPKPQRVSSGYKIGLKQGWPHHYNNVTQHVCKIHDVSFYFQLFRVICEVTGCDGKCSFLNDLTMT